MLEGVRTGPAQSVDSFFQSTKDVKACCHNPEALQYPVGPMLRYNVSVNCMVVVVVIELNNKFNV